MKIKDIEYVRTRVTDIARYIGEDDDIKRAMYYLGVIASFLDRFIPEEIDNK